jgi:hypothetical protein
LQSHDENLLFGISIEMLVGVKVLDKIDMRDIECDLIQSVSDNHISIRTSSFPKFECVSCLGSFYDIFDIRKLKRGEWLNMYFIAQAGYISDVALIKLLGLGYTSIDE